MQLGQTMVPSATRSRFGIVFLVAIFGTVPFASPLDSCVAAQDPPSAASTSLPTVDWEVCDWVDAYGKPASLPEVEGSSFRVLLLISTECPLARLYVERCQTLSSRWSSVDWRVIAVTPQDGPTDMQRFQSEMSLTLPLIKETSGALIDALELERVPTAVLVSGAGEVKYMGRVDDQYEVGERRPEATRSELIEAIEACLQGDSVPVSRTEAPGCLITRKRPLSESSTVTYSEHVAAILDRRCNSCHRPGDIGPMSFLDGEETSNWSDMILEVIEDGRMPPWNSTDDSGTFVNENRLTPDELQTIRDWVEQGAPLGDPSARPGVPAFASSWRMPTEPDEIIELPAGGFEVPASGTVDYQYFVIDPGWTEDRWVKAVQLLPGASSVVHHAIAFTRSPETHRFDGLGMLAAFVPGQEPTRYTSNMARRIPAGSKIVFQMHYTPSGRVETDCSKLGLWFADESEVEWEVVTGMVVDSSFEIPPEASRFVVTEDHASWPDGARLLSLAPHMHVRGRSVEVDLNRDSETRRLLTVPAYDFNWQHTYKFAEPVELADGWSIESRMTFDNSSGNVANPDPKRYVRWGEQTWEEMAVLFLDIALPRDLTRTRSTAIAERKDQERIKLETFIARFDRDRSGSVERSEVPETFGVFAFDRQDRNNDSLIDLSDLEETER